MIYVGLTLGLMVFVIICLIAPTMDRKPRPSKGEIIRLQRERITELETKLNNIKSTDERLVDELIRRGREEAKRLEDYFRRNS